MNEQIKQLIVRCMDSHLKLNGIAVQQECVIVTNFLNDSGKAPAAPKAPVEKKKALPRAKLKKGVKK